MLTHGSNSLGENDHSLTGVVPAKQPNKTGKARPGPPRSESDRAIPENRTAVAVLKQI
jgi:hypothetical protein